MQKKVCLIVWLFSLCLYGCGEEPPMLKVKNESQIPVLYKLGTVDAFSYRTLAPGESHETEWDAESATATVVPDAEWIAEIKAARMSLSDYYSAVKAGQQGGSLTPSQMSLIAKDLNRAYTAFDALSQRNSKKNTCTVHWVQRKENSSCQYAYEGTSYVTIYGSGDGLGLDCR
jgi:hypothetical protein